MSKKILVLATLAIFVIGLGAYGYSQGWLAGMISNPSGQDQTDNPRINYDPPTEEEQQTGDLQKEQLADEQDDENVDGKKDASVIIVDAGQYDNTIEVRSFVSNHIQEGTCLYSFTRGNDTVEKSLPAHPDASTTICPALEVARSEFPAAGKWQLVVSYDSEGAKGSSETKAVTIN